MKSVFQYADSPKVGRRRRELGAPSFDPSHYLKNTFAKEESEEKPKSILGDSIKQNRFHHLNSSTPWGTSNEKPSSPGYAAISSIGQAKKRDVPVEDRGAGLSNQELKSQRDHNFNLESSHN